MTAFDDLTWHEAMRLGHEARVWPLSCFHGPHPLP